MVKKGIRLSKKQRQRPVGRIRNRFKNVLLQKSAEQGERISLREVARNTGISLSTLSAWQNNRVTRLDVNHLAALCEFLGCTPGDLLEYTPPQKRE